MTVESEIEPDDEADEYDYTPDTIPSYGELWSRED